MLNEYFDKEKQYRQHLLEARFTEGKKATLKVLHGSLGLSRFTLDGCEPVKIKEGMLNASGKNSLTIEMN